MIWEGFYRGEIRARITLRDGRYELHEILPSNRREIMGIYRSLGGAKHRWWNYDGRGTSWRAVEEAQHAR